MTIIGKSFLQIYKTQSKALAPRLRDASARFDPNAIDGDDDGKVQDGTRFERPALRRAMARLAGSISNSSPGDPIPIASASQLREFDGFDADHIIDVYANIRTQMEQKYGTIKTVKDAVDALKQIAQKVDLSFFGPNFDGNNNGRSRLNDDLDDIEINAIYAVLYALQDVQHLKKRRLMLVKSNDGTSFQTGGSTSIKPRVKDIADRTSGQHPEFAVRIEVPAHYDALHESHFSDDVNDFSDGVATQIARQVAIEAEKQTDPNKRQMLINASIMFESMAVSTHESVHAIAIPMIADEMLANARRLRPNAMDDFELLEEISKTTYATDDEVFKVGHMADIIRNLLESNNPISGLIQQSMLWRDAATPQEHLDLLKQIQQNMNVAGQTAIQEAQAVVAEIQNGNLNPLEQIAAMAWLNQQQENLEMLRERLQEIVNDAVDLEANIQAGTPENSRVAQRSEWVLRDGLNYLFDIIPPGHPGHGKDVALTVDELGNLVPFTDDRGAQIKDPYSSIEYMESSIIAMLQSADFQAWVANTTTAMPKNMGTLGMLEALTDQSNLTTVNGQVRFDSGPTIAALDPDVLQRYLDLQRYMHFNAETNFVWPPGFSQDKKAKLLHWMRDISFYGSFPHHRYLGGVSFASATNINASEIYPELVTSLLWGAGAARIPMTPDVRKSVIDILNWLYSGDSWKAKMPQISLEALGISPAAGV